MTHTGSARDPGDVGQQFQVAHQKLQQVMVDLAAARDLPELLQRLVVFRTSVTAHFQTEEEPGGFLEFLRARSSSKLRRLHDVEREHQAFLAAIDQLELRARECLAGPIADILRQARDMTDQLRRHEAAEGRLMMDILYTDSGAQE